MSNSLKLPRKLDKDLVLRQSTKNDAERLGIFYTTVFKMEDGTPEMSFIPWVKDFLNGEHPTFGEGDFTIVEDIKSGQIVSAMNLISQTWTVGGIAIPVGRPEAVATTAEYRNQGLVRAQFEVVHAWSRQRGELIQGITGIPYYYRIFGYEMCIDLGGGRIGYPGSLPAPSKEQIESYIIRPAEEQDLAVLTQLYQQGCNRLLVACPRDESLWRFELSGHSPGIDDALVICIIESKHKIPLGFFLHSPHLGPDYEDPNSLRCSWIELKAGVSYQDVVPVILDHLIKTGQKMGEQEGKVCKSVGLYSEEEHPAMQVAKQWLPQVKKPYAWYIRVADLSALLNKIAPLLENRLESSCCTGYDGVLNITFYTSKLTIAFKKGKLSEVKQVPFHGEEGCQAAFPGQTFLHLVFGYRTLEEVQYMFPDCWAEDSAFLLLNALFPRLPSNIWPIS